MMEQEVFHTFVSWHLLDWLYPYIKKWTFLSWLNIEKNTWPYKIVWYISNIQRARKKWYFIEIEDISGKREFFFKDILDFKKFDIVIISGFKSEWRYPRISKLVKTDRETLIKNAWSSFDPEITVTKAKGMRLWENKIELLKEESINKNEETMELEIESITEEVNKTEEKIVEEEKTEAPSIPTFEIPNNLWDIEVMKTILEQYPWDIVIKIGNITKAISSEWLTQLKSLL